MRHLKKFKQWKIFLIIALYNCLGYAILQKLSTNRTAHSLTTVIDTYIPYIPWTILIYIGSYVFWFLLYNKALSFSAKENKEFAISELFGKTICFIIIVLFPTTMVRANIQDESVFDNIVQLIYNLDVPFCLLPSLHCYNSWMCWIGIRDKNVHSGIKMLTFWIAVAICVSTLTVKQHIIVDVISAIAIAEISHLTVPNLLSKMKNS